MTGLYLFDSQPVPHLGNENVQILSLCFSCSIIGLSAQVGDVRVRYYQTEDFFARRRQLSKITKVDSFV